MLPSGQDTTLGVIPSGHDAQPADQSVAKLSIKNPGGAIRRKDTTAISSMDRVVRISGSVAVLPTNSPVVNAKGLESHPPGSTGKASRPATVKLLAFPPASAAQRWLKSVVASSGFCPRGTILPLAGEIGD